MATKFVDSGDENGDNQRKWAGPSGMQPEGGLMENLVVALEIAKRLKAAGFVQTTEFTWYCDEERDDTPVLNWTDLGRVVGGVGHYDHYYAAPTAQEIADQLRAEGHAWNMTAYQSRYEVVPFEVYPTVWAETMAVTLAMLWLAPQEADNGSK